MILANVEKLKTKKTNTTKRILVNMLDEIKNYWHQLKTEYENKYNKPFLKEFQSSKEYLEKMKS